MKRRKTKNARKKFRSLSRFAKGAFAVSKSDLSPAKLKMLQGLLKNRRRGLRRNPKATDGMTPREKLRYYVSGAIERGEGKAIAGMPMMTMKRRRRKLRRNEEFARQIPRRDRSMRGRGFDKRFDVSAGSDYKDLYKILTDGNRGVRKLGDNTWLYFFSDKKEIVVKLYQTPILTYYPNGDVDVNFGGYMTTTTFSRINNLVPYGWNLRKKAGKLALENSWGQRAIVRKPRAGEEYAVRLTPDKAYIID